MTEEKPKLFISYSWSSPEHEQWVLALAEELVRNGVDVIIDKWDLKAGHDAFAFMEKMVTDPDVGKVVIICDQKYAEKADERKGGVGTETQIITPEIYAKTEQGKFVAVVAEKDENEQAYLPAYFKTRIYIDLSDDDLYSKNFEQLLRWIYDEPIYIKPELGKKPSFVSAPSQDILGTRLKFKRSLEAIRNNKSYSKGATEEFFRAFTQNLEKFRIVEIKGEIDERVIENIEDFLPYRNEAIEIFLALAQYLNTPETAQQLHRFFEDLLPYLERPSHISGGYRWDTDNFKFIIHELFLYAIASLLKYECFDSASYLIQQQYYLEERNGSSSMVSFSEMRPHLQSLENRNKRLKLRRLSLHADLLKQRADAFGYKFRQVMQADFVLYLQDCFEAIRGNTRQRWYPETLIYLEYENNAFEFFARAQSKAYFENLKVLFAITQKDDFEPLFEAMREGKLFVPKWDFHILKSSTLAGYEKLASRP